MSLQQLPNTLLLYNYCHYFPDVPDKPGWLLKYDMEQSGCRKYRYCYVLQYCKQWRWSQSCVYECLAYFPVTKHSELWLSCPGPSENLCLSVAGAGVDQQQPQRKPHQRQSGRCLQSVTPSNILFVAHVKTAVLVKSLRHSFLKEHK